MLSDPEKVGGLTACEKETGMDGTTAPAKDAADDEGSIAPVPLRSAGCNEEPAAQEGTTFWVPQPPL